MKKCSKCGELKELVCFGINRRNKTDGHQPKCKACNILYYEANKEKIKKRIGKHYKDNHDEVLKRRTDMRKRPEATKKKAIQDKKYRESNKEKLAEFHKVYDKENRERISKYYKQWTKFGPKDKSISEYKPEYEAFYKHLGKRGEDYRKFKYLEHNNRRRARKKLNGNNTLTAKQIEHILKSQPFCSYCGNRDKLELDHVVPLSTGGQNNIDNIVVACKKCNTSKGNKKLVIWLAGL